MIPILITLALAGLAAFGLIAVTAYLVVCHGTANDSDAGPTHLEE